MRYAFSLASLMVLNHLLPVDAADVVSMPIHFLYAKSNKVTTPMMVGSVSQQTGQTMEVVVDFGSRDFWLFSPNATVNYGSRYLGFEGACNAKPSDFYHPSNGTTIYDFVGSYSYGGNSKTFRADKAVNDTLFFPSYLPGSPIPNIQVALVNHGQIRQPVPAGTPCPELSYNQCIMGLMSLKPNEPSGPNIKANLLAQSRIQASQVSMYFTPPPNDAPIAYNHTGTLLFGALPPRDSYTGELVSTPLVTPQDGRSGYYIAQLPISYNGTRIPADEPDEPCYIDSGSLALSLPYNVEDSDFFTRTGLQNYSNAVMYPSDCEDIPRDLSLDFGVGPSTTVKVPYRNLATGGKGPGAVIPKGMCPLSVALGGKCTLGAPWFLGMAVGVDDKAGLVWIAQGKA
ncbi:hypothetical protein DSL72_004744 [Monilinia vaccinii-corymbosi]|uniref:Peptidase A1 domain-containing protein n=1 Tax=Monilinia vaccinii-corymbosi TaxID=61207 RepID=A0A8A3P017_9HELO|nr:hypothetical protein DSL72_004744 [Monilinia vaccinii-corymbosi]